MPFYSIQSMVENEWSGTNLVVTDAWDNDGGHSTYSLHREGRAADIITSDRTLARLPQLAAFAVR